MWEKNLSVEPVVLISAIRYSLPRMTYMPSIVIDNTKANIDLLEQGEIDIIIKDIKNHRDMFGWNMECDKATWISFLEYLENINR